MSVIEEKKALRTYIRQTERTLDPAYKAESSEAICRCVLALEEYRAAGTVFAFAGTVHEIDTSLLLKETLAAARRSSCALRRGPRARPVRGHVDGRARAGDVRHFRAEGGLRARHARRY